MYWHEFLVSQKEENEELITDPLTSGPKPLTYRQFINLLADVLAAAWGEEWRDRFGPEAPIAREMTTPYIAYSLRQRVPSDEPRGNLEPRLRGKIKDQNNPQASFDVYGQLYDHLIRFNCSAPSAGMADELAEKFDEFMVTYKPLFIREGVRRLFLVEQGADYWEEDQKEPTFYRPLIYLVRLDRVFAVPVSSLNTVSTHLNISLPEL